MKKIFTMVVTLCFILVILTACGGGSDSDTQDAEKSSDKTSSSVSLKDVRNAVEAAGYKTSDTVYYMGIPEGTKGFSFTYHIDGSETSNSVVEFANEDELNSYIDMTGEGVNAVNGLMLSGVSEATDTAELEFLEKVLDGNPPSDYVPAE